MKYILAIFLFVFLSFAQPIYAVEDCFGDPNPIRGVGNCGCLNNTGRCYFQGPTPGGIYNVNSGPADCVQTLGTPQICYVQAPTPTTDLTITPTVTPNPISTTQPGTGGDQTVPPPGQPTWTPTPTDIPNETDVLLEFEELPEMEYGVTCGVTGGEGTTNQCCVRQAPNINIRAPLFGDINFISNPVNGFINRVSGVFALFQSESYKVSDKVGMVDEVNPYCKGGIPVKPDGTSAITDEVPFVAEGCFCDSQKGGFEDTPYWQMCQVVHPDERGDCVDCLSSTAEPGVWTSLGCIKTDLSTFITETVFGTALSIATLVALGCIIYASFLMQTSQGNPEQIQKAQEMITSCITGLIMIIFSVFILRVIGVDILRIPWLSNETSTTATPTGAPTGTTPTPVPTRVPTRGPIAGGPTSTVATPTTVIAASVTTPTSTPSPSPTSIITGVVTNTPIPTITPTPTPSRNLALGDFDCDPAIPEPRSNEVYLYDEDNYSGACLRLSLEFGTNFNLQNVANALTTGGGNWFGSCSGSFNDCISSLKIGSDVGITLYEMDHSNAKGGLGNILSNCKITPIGSEVPEMSRNDSTYVNKEGCDIVNPSNDMSFVVLSAK